MRYFSTRGHAPVLNFDDVLLTGLARDGGLYLPESWPQLSPDLLRSLSGAPYAEVARQVMAPFVAGSAIEEDFGRLVAEAYADFEHASVTPLRQLDPDLWLMELFHGPTLAFKDVALQLLGRLFDAVLEARGERLTIVGATSGDTGSAAIEACRDRERVDIFILHPHGRTSEVQRRQMTTVEAPNVHNIAVEGTFDDCQDLVKAMFNDAAFRDRLQMSAVNSINWARIMAQIVYYVQAAVSLGAPERRVSFSVPTGNFGNVFAGYAARRMGVPIERLLVGSNSNDILTRFFESGVMAVEEVQPTLSPSMDIQVSSNFERLLCDIYERDGDRLTETLEGFRKEGQFRIDPELFAALPFEGHRLDDAETLAEIERSYQAYGELLDPHTAIGVASARQSATRRPETPSVALATAHPAKFPDAVFKATGKRPELPERLSDLYERQERYVTLPGELARLQTYIEGHARITKDVA
ncbi:MAG: threonine synthase [Pseudomonadota bacterium]|uniref:threonine synthase n=1 Tax=Fodinicurvata fenggangensis TaxID=1121830 RepID=UPI00047EAE6D|nr:threonine synthase [Fodinicurvata fenggangensis]